MAKYSTAPFTSPLCRISYAQGLHQTNKYDKYGVTLIFQKDQMAVLQKAIQEVVTGEWGDKGVDRFKRDLIKNPILAGDGKSAMDRETGDIKQGLGPDVVFIRPTSTKPIKCFGPDTTMMDAQDIVSGHYGKAVLNAFAWHNPEQGDGVSFGISMWQHIKEGESLGGGVPSDPTKFFGNETVDTGGEGPSGEKGGASDMFG